MKKGLFTIIIIHRGDYKVKIKLLAFDFDGTILEEGMVIPESTRERLDMVKDLGIKISTASGRKLEDQFRILDLNLLGDKSGYPHFLIVDESRIYLLDGKGYTPLESWNDKVSNEWRELYPLAEEILLEEIEGLKIKGEEVSIHIIGETALIRNMVAMRFSSIEKAKEYEKYLSEKLKSINSPFWCNRNFSLVQILPPSAGKGNTVLALSRYLNISPNEVLVIGDSGNDVDMLDGRYGFRSATVSNADPEIKDVVKKNGGYVARNPISRGVIEIIDELILKNL